MPFRWSLNPYQGCVHGCHYCFARGFNLYRDLDAGQDFTNIISVKVNAPKVLREELSRPSWRREAVAIGTATDPYQPIEGRYRLTRGCLEALAERRTPATVITKGTLAVRDADVMADLARRAECTVAFSVTTVDAELARRLEPGVPPPLSRLWALERLALAGVNAGVLVAPIVPGITDNIKNLESVVRAAAEHGARWVGGQALHLKPGTREHFLGFLRREHPSLLREYERLYRGGLAPRWFRDEVSERLGGLVKRYGVEGGGAARGSASRREQQLELALPIFPAPSPPAAALGHPQAEGRVVAQGHTTSQHRPLVPPLSLEQVGNAGARQEEEAQETQGGLRKTERR